MDQHDPAPDTDNHVAEPGARLRVRPLVSADLPDLIRIDGESYAPELRESEAAFLSKLVLFRAGALGCFDGDQMCGYAFALPWKAGTLIGVAQVLDALPADPDVMYVHDMVVAPACRRRGVASTLLGEIARVAEALHLSRFALVAVQGSEPFWQRAGFQAVETFEYVPGVAATKMEMTV
jgi:GNAT superfamily N-acetyltransferase